MASDDLGSPDIPAFASVKPGEVFTVQCVGAYARAHAA